MPPTAAADRIAALRTAPSSGRRIDCGATVDEYISGTDWRIYADGYGKESLILNLDDAGYDKHGALYFTACLLSFYQQLWLWDTHRDKIAEFNIEKPLWVFVGNTVSGEDGDVLAVLKFLASFLNDHAQAIEWIGDLIADKARLLDSRGNDVFAGRFVPLMQRDAATIYADILRRLFNAEARQRLKLVNLKGSKGELALRVGNAPHFGVINIGDDAGFFKTAEDVDAFDTETDDFGSGLFGTINQEGSKLNVLIGSRKFTEGWSSWRVSTTGLLNMGQGEGSQIIQLFGRGVRLKGKGMSLKRSLPHERPKDHNFFRPLDGPLQGFATESFQAAPLERPKMAELLGRRNLARYPSAPATSIFRLKSLKNNGFIFEFKPRVTLSWP